VGLLHTHTAEKSMLLNSYSFDISIARDKLLFNAVARCAGSGRELSSCERVS
jgi:hypothetical protein